ncbi:hypothetical protein H311_02000, partial [Anncaliia algerae PRA109]
VVELLTVYGLLVGSKAHLRKNVSWLKCRIYLQKHRKPHFLFVLPGSVAYTDCFKSYTSGCRNLKLPHFSVNHSIEFVNFDTGVCTNRFDKQNSGIKHLIRPRKRNKKNINGWLWYLIWKRKIKKSY